MEATPVNGQGLGYLPGQQPGSTDDPSKITAYVGYSAVDATAVDVVSLSATTKTMTLKDAPPADSTVYVTQYTNLLPDDTWTLTCQVAAETDGTYVMSGQNTGTAMNVSWSVDDTFVADPDFASEKVTYPSGTGPGNSDAQVMPGYAVQETVSLTFIGDGTNASTSYVVTSSDPNGTGSLGDNTGYLNQTYIDNRTGFRVTVNQGSSVDYTGGDYIGYMISPEFVTGSQPTLAVPGIRVTVTDTENVGAGDTGDTGILRTYNKSGNEPDVGDFYYVSFNENKDNMEEAMLFTVEKDALAYTGALSQTNKLGLAAHLCFLNGAAVVILYQIPKAVGEEDAPDSAYISGIDYFNEPMPGGYRPALMQPVTTSNAVLQYLRQSNTIQSGERYMNERMTYFGFPLNTSPTTAQAYARSMSNERMIGIYPDGAITTITDELGNDIEYVVDGSILAAAISGRDTSPAFDVAEPLDRKPIVGFTRLYRRMDAVTAAQTANAGLTVLEEQAAGIVIKIALTTDTTSVLTRTPSVIRIKDFVQRGTRSVLDPYIGTKFLAQRLAEITSTLGSYLQALKKAQIILDYTGISAKQDENDPTTINVEAYYAPILPLLWIRVTFNLRTKLS